MNIEYVFAITLVSLGIYCVASKKNLIKKIIGLAIITDGIHLFLMEIGFKLSGVTPILPSVADLRFFVRAAVDPLPQALVLTSIVIDLSITALALTIAINVYLHFKTLNTEKLRRLRG